MIGNYLVIWCNLVPVEITAIYEKIIQISDFNLDILKEPKQSDMNKTEWLILGVTRKLPRAMNACIYLYQSSNLVDI